MTPRGLYIPYYLVDKKWVKEKPLCIPKIPKQDD
jgi:hypothetical protein